MAKRNTVLLVVMGILAALPSTSAAAVEKRIGEAWRSIQANDVYGYCKTLASREFAGRHTGHEGYTKAAKWAAQKFRQWGLSPIGKNGGYLQPFPAPYSQILKAEMSVFLPEKTAGAGDKAEWKETKLQATKDFMPLLFSDGGQAKAEVVFAGWGIHAPELGYDDYAGIDAKGRFVLCFRGVPDGADKRFQHHDEHRTRMQTAKEMGALGLVYIYAEVQAHPNGEHIAGFLPAMISESFADILFKEKGVTCADLKKDLALYKRPLSFPLQAQFDLRVEARHFPDGTGYNVAGFIPGSDPRLKDECVILGAHFDGQGEHLGMLFAGADDNASGSAVVMEAAEAFSRPGARPKRSVMFALFGGEEMGLLGSYHFADHLPPFCKKVALMINLDMEGEGDRAYASFSQETAALKILIEEADRDLKIIAGTWPIRGVGVRSSDFAPFFLRGAPCVSFFSNGPHLAYHQTGDSIYRINPDIMADITRLAFLVAYRWADR